jgi:hypothetical protein
MEIFSTFRLKFDITCRIHISISQDSWGVDWRYIQGGRFSALRFTNFPSADGPQPYGEGSFIRGKELQRHLSDILQERSLKYLIHM